MDSVMTLFTSALRYILPIALIFILSVCVISLFRNRPRVHKIAQLVDQNNGAVMDINHWETSIGRSKSNDIVLPLPSVSRFHAVIAKKRRDWVITDTFSKTGVTVNGEAIEQGSIIEDGDVIMIAGIPLKFLCAEAVSAQSKSKMRSAAKSISPNENNVAYAVLVDVKTRKPVYLRKKDVLIGRDAAADIQIVNQAISGEHARLHLTSKGWALSDMESHNGTKLNGRFIDQPQLVFDEDLITFGDKVFVFYEK